MYSVEMKQKSKSKCGIPNETRGNRSWAKINPKAHEKYPMSINILKSQRRFYTVILKHQGMHNIIAFKVSVYIMG